jgi:hypothetical protein
VAHSEGDSGGEFVAAFQTNLSFYHPDQWCVDSCFLFLSFSLFRRNYSSTSIFLAMYPPL